MGGDHGPAVSVPAAMAVTHRADVVLVGDEGRIRDVAPVGEAGITVHHAGAQVQPGQSLGEVLRHEPDTSMRQALLLHAEGRVDAVVSAGDTAALMALSRSLLHMVSGIERPAICKDLQGVTGPFWMLDLGANLACTPTQLEQFARMGAAAARQLGGIGEPRVALLNIGTEARKGPEELRAAAALLEAAEDIDYRGFIEASAVFSGNADVVVTEGFTGNVALKAIEGAARMAGHLLQRWMASLNPLEQAALRVTRGKLGALRHELNPQRYNGASFIGLAGVVVKSHGSADVDGFTSAIDEALLEVAGRLPDRLVADFRGRA